MRDLTGRGGSTGSIGLARARVTGRWLPTAHGAGAGRVRQLR